MKNPLSQISTKKINLLSNNLKKRLGNCNSALDNVHKIEKTCPR